MFSRRITKTIATGAAALAVGGGTYAIVSATASGGSAAAGTAPTTTIRSDPASRPGAAGAANARSGPASGGTVGTVSSMSTSSFTVSTTAGQQVTVDWASTAHAIKAGERVLVLGTTNGTSITAVQVIAQPARATSATSSTVIPFQRGAPSTSKQIGQIPASYRQGSGTIVGGTTANEATEAALSAYPGGLVDRVVKLSNNEYEVHNIGVNWPHHIFVDKNFKVIGAN